MAEKMVRDPWHRNKLIREGICKAIYVAMKTNERIYLLGEGAHMKVHFDAPYIEKDFPQRTITMPISEDGNSNFAVGMAIGGLIPVVDVISSDFLFRTMDAICNTMAKLGTVQEPRTMIVKAEFLTGGPTSGQRIEAMFAHVPGLRVVVPSNAYDAFHLTKDALKEKAVTILFEDRMIKDDWLQPLTSSDIAEMADVDDVGETVSEPITPKVTVVSYGLTQVLAERALGSTGAKLFDLRTLYPLRTEPIIASVAKTRRLLVVEPDAAFMGIGAEIVAQVAEAFPTGCRVRRLGGPRSVIPASRELHDRMIPTEGQILAAYEELAQ